MADSSTILNASWETSETPEKKPESASRASCGISPVMFR